MSISWGDYTLKAVLFDLGGTLLKMPPILRIYKKILSRQGINAQLPNSDSIIEELEQGLTLEMYTLPYDEFWRLYNMKFLKLLGIQDNLAEIADVITQEWWKTAEPKIYEDVLETLMIIKKLGLKIGLVTNAFRKEIREILPKLGLEDIFEVIVGVDDVGKPKPAKEIFNFALKQLKVKPGEALYVGDNPKTDYEGAENAGLKPLLVDRRKVIVGEYRRIKNLTDVIKYL